MRRAWFCIVFCTACHDLVVLPDVPDGMVSAIIVVDPPKGERRITAASIDEHLPSFSGPSEADVSVFFYRRSVADLLLAGEVAAAEPNEGRLLPCWDGVFQGVVEDGAISAWQQAAPEPVWITKPPLATCADNGGCNWFCDKTSAYECTAPCPNVDLKITAPSPPELFCPPGWQRGVTACTPPPTVSCPDHQVQWHDSETCEPLGASCPAGDWSAIPSSGPIVYVLQTSTTTADGSQKAPYRDLQRAIDNAPDEAIIALAKETYGDVQTNRDLTLWGACVEETIIGGVTQTAGQLQLRNLQSQGQLSANNVALEDLLFVGDANPAVRVAGGALTATAVLIRGRRIGIQLQRSTARTKDLAFVDVKRAVDLVAGQAEMIDLTIRGAEEGVGSMGSIVSITRGLIDDIEDFGVELINTTQTTSIADLVVRGDRATGYAFGTGPNGGIFDLRRVVVEDFGGVALLLTFGSRATVQDWVVSSVGKAAVSSMSASLTVNRAVFTDCAASGFFLSNSELWAADLELRHVRNGVLATSGSRVWLERASITDARGTGICIGSEAVVTAHDLEIRGTGMTDLEDPSCSQRTSPAGNGITMWDVRDLFGRLSVERFLVVDSYNIGIDAIVGSRTVTATTGEIRGNNVGMRVSPAFHDENLIEVRFEDNTQTLSLE